MKLKSLGKLLALVALGASCTNDLTDDSGTRVPQGRTEIQVNFSGSGESQEYSPTRAIASESENRIDKLEVYLFASDRQDGVYRFLEMWEEGTAYDPTNPADLNFRKQASGTGWKASLYPGELKGLPWIKLLCVVNNGVDGHTGIADGKFYEEGTADKTAPVQAEKAALVPVKVDDDGNITNEADATTEALFKNSFTRRLDPAAYNTGVIEVPLMMTGEGVTKISGSVSKVNVELKRIMARFDVENDKQKSNLTIQKITLKRGRSNGALWGSKRTVVAKAEFEKSAHLTDYTTIDYTTKAGANRGIVESVFYAYPNLDSDQAYLTVEGTYKSPVTSNDEPVVYNIDLAETPKGTDVAKFINLKPNSRYKLKIMDVTKSHIFATFEVVDWTSGGGIDVKPENDAPVFDPATAFANTKDGVDNAHLPKDLNAQNPDATTYDYEVQEESGNFKIRFAATGKVRAEKHPLLPTRAGEDSWMDWGTVTSEEIDGVWYTEFSVNYSEAVGASPVQVNFINDAASFDPALWTTINFYGPKQVPLFFEAKNIAIPASPGNKVDVTVDEMSGTNNSKAPKVTLYRIENSYVYVDVEGAEGIAVQTPMAGVTAEKVKSDGRMHTYKIYVSDASASTVSGKIKFENSGDTSKTTEMEVTIEDAGMKFESDGAVDSSVKVTPAAKDANGYETGVEVKIDLAAFAGKSYKFKVFSPIAPEAGDIPTLICPDLTISQAAHDWAEDEPYTLYTIQPTGGQVSKEVWTKLTFRNPLALTDSLVVAPGLDVQMKKDFTKPAFSVGTTTASWSTFNTGLTSSNSEIEMYRVNGSAVTVSVECSGEEIEFKTVAGISVTQIGSTDEYVVAVTDTASLVDKNGADLVVYNKKAKDAEGEVTTRQATIKLKMKDSAITWEMTGDAGGAAIRTDDAIEFKIDASNPNYVPLKIELTGFAGSAIAVNLPASDSWLKTSGITPAEIETTGTPVEIKILEEETGIGSDNATIVITNAIPGGPNKTITITKGTK